MIIVLSVLSWLRILEVSKVFLLIFALRGIHHSCLLEIKLVQNWCVSKTEQFEILPYLQANKLAFHSSMDTGRRHEIFRWKRKDNLLLITVVIATLFHFSLVFWASVPIRQCHEGWWLLRTWYIALRKRNPQFRKPKCFVMDSNPAWTLHQREGGRREGGREGEGEREIIFIILDSKKTCSLLQRETLCLSSMVVCYPWKDSPEKR